MAGEPGDALAGAAAALTAVVGRLQVASGISNAIEHLGGIAEGTPEPPAE